MRNTTSATTTMSNTTTTTVVCIKVRYDNGPGCTLYWEDEGGNDIPAWKIPPTVREEEADKVAYPKPPLSTEYARFGYKGMSKAKGTPFEVVLEEHPPMPEWMRLHNLRNYPEEEGITYPFPDGSYIDKSYIDKR